MVHHEQYAEIVKAAKSASTRSAAASRPPHVLKAKQMYTPTCTT